MQSPLILYLMICLLSAGCGTLNNVVQGTPPAEPPHVYVPAMEVYGGVKSDLRDANTALTGPHERTWTEVGERLTVAAFSIADLPLSAVGDTIMLAKTVEETRQRQEQAQLEAAR